jgi:hypothetical protein
VGGCPISEYDYLHGCDGGTWNGVAEVLIGHINSPLKNGLATKQYYTDPENRTISQQEYDCKNRQKSYQKKAFRFDSGGLNLFAETYNKVKID